MDEQWLKRAIANGFAMLVLLKLKNAPREDEIKHVMEAWFRAITYKKRFEQTIDEPRFNAAFAKLAQTCEWFPTPKELFDALPARKEPKLTQIEYKSDPETARKNIEKLKKMIKGAYVRINKT
ncbi:hypothetical protein CEP76_03105 [[Haemophilus] ducreyi]|uniref:Uncharacterized protein n=1 Tax=Haemophilus ducreyi (strain 35000HP / ATCC 700724) TaxID=233412 RepID=Q7VPH0_HAEDU|nr:hypothetical protein [[Haemophilus] ducreyi]AAP95111.1 hypothetical protein HD_0108 [[Haemophilus] ducreyi 35000HP]ASE06727.1 hypothetical protein CEP76_03105 [[Haemophilus] ducreyi]